MHLLIILVKVVILWVLSMLVVILGLELLLRWNSSREHRRLQEQKRFDENLARLRQDPNIEMITAVQMFNPQVVDGRTGERLL
jgi:hypothetical protein